MKLITIIQARVNSSRFPSKILEKFNDKTLLEILINRLKRSSKLKKIIVATTTRPEDRIIEKICNKTKIDCFKGSEFDLTDRYFQAAKKFKAQNIVRITSDCPLIDPKIIDKVVSKFFQKKTDYSTNIMPPTYPDGMDVEIFNFKALEKAWQASRKQKKYREHVTTHIIENRF